MFSRCVIEGECSEWEVDFSEDDNHEDCKGEQPADEINVHVELLLERSDCEQVIEGEELQENDDVVKGQPDEEEASKQYFLKQDQQVVVSSVPTGSFYSLV